MSTWRIDRHPDKKSRPGYFIIVRVHPDGATEQWGYAIFGNVQVAAAQIEKIIQGETHEKV